MGTDATPIEVLRAELTGTSVIGSLEALAATLDRELAVARETWGVFPVDEFFLLHTGVASGMAVAFGVLVIALKWWVPGIARAFLSLGWLFVGVIVVLAVMFATGAYTLTAVELVAGVLVFAWIILFIRNAAALQADATP